MESIILIGMFTYFVRSLSPCRVANVLKEVLPPFCSLLTFLKSGFFSDDQEVEEHDSMPCCSDENITDDDISVVMKKVGMIGWRLETSCQDNCELLETALRFLEEKEATLNELEEAFYVFDRNEDGFISPGELWSVLRRLGFKEGVSLEDCERMISVFDANGDGRIDFNEFRNMLENAC